MIRIHRHTYTTYNRRIHINREFTQVGYQVTSRYTGICRTPLLQLYKPDRMNFNSNIIISSNWAIAYKFVLDSISQNNLNIYARYCEVVRFEPVHTCFRMDAEGTLEQMVDALADIHIQARVTVLQHNLLA